MGVELAGNERLVMIHKVSLIQLLPESYLERIRATPGVVDACSQTYFGGIYQDPKNFFMQIPVDPECMLRMYPEFMLPDEQKKAWIADRRAPSSAARRRAKFGWKVGDRIPLQATIWRKKDNSSNWEFNLDGIYDGTEQGTDETQFFFHYEYLDESRLFGQGNVGWYVVRIANASQAPQIAATLDEQFANSPAETKTTTEKAFVQAFANQVGNIALIVRSIIAMAFFIILLVTANTMARVGARAHERTRGPQDAGLLRRPGAGAGAGRVVHHRRRGRPARARPGGDRRAGDSHREPPAGPLRAEGVVWRRHRARRRAGPRRRHLPGPARDAPAHRGRATEGVTAMWIFSGLFQAAVVTALNLRTLRGRLASSGVAVVGMAGVVAVLVSVLSIAEGIRATMASTGSPDTAIVLRTGSDSEMTSILLNEDVRRREGRAGDRAGARRRARSRRPSCSSASIS